MPLTISRSSVVVIAVSCLMIWCHLANSAQLDVVLLSPTPGEEISRSDGIELRASVNGVPHMGGSVEAIHVALELLDLTQLDSPWSLFYSSYEFIQVQGGHFEGTLANWTAEELPEPPITGECLIRLVLTTGGMSGVSDPVQLFVVEMGAPDQRDLTTGSTIQEEAIATPMDLAIAVDQAPPYVVDQALTFHIEDPNRLEGLLLSFKWDFGDGTTSYAASPPCHIYGEPAEYTVSLTGYSEAGHRGISTTSNSVALRVESMPPPVEAVRTIAGLPTSLDADSPRALLADHPSESPLHVRITIAYRSPERAQALIVRERVPDGWTSVPVLAMGDAVTRLTSDGWIEWLLWGPFEAGSTASVDYALLPPVTTAGAPAIPLGTYQLLGEIDFNPVGAPVAIGGACDIQVVGSLPLEVVVCHMCWRTSTVTCEAECCLSESDIALTAASIDTTLSHHLIDDEQLEIATALWEYECPVPYTGGLLLDANTLLDIISWHHNGLPGGTATLPSLDAP